MMQKKKLVSDIILIASLLVIALSVFIFILVLREEGSSVTVSIDGEFFAEYPLEHNGEYSLNGGTNILVIEDGEAFVREANCPDHLCVHQGKISQTGQRIVCLPYRVLVEVK